MRLFRRPEPVEAVMALTPDDPPSQFRWRGQLHRVRRAEGPERIGEEWWKARRSSDVRVGHVRDYYRVEDDDGAPLLAVPRRPLRRPETPAEVVAARAVRMTRYAELQADHATSPSCAAPRIPGELVVGRRGPGPGGDRRLRPQHPGRRGARLVGAGATCEAGSKIRALTGCRLDFADGTPSLLVYPSDREAYGRLTRLLTVGQRRAKKGECELHWADFLDHAEGQLVLVVPPDRLDEAFEARPAAASPASLPATSGWPPPGATARATCSGCRGWRRWRQAAGAPMVATNDVLYHGPERRPLQDVLTCIRESCTIARGRPAAGGQRRAPPEAARARWRGCSRASPARWSARVEIAERIGFDLGAAALRIPRRAGAAGQDRHPAPARPDLGGRAPGAIRDGVPEKVRRTCSTRSSS